MTQDDRKIVSVHRQDDEFGSGGVRLDGRQWIAVIVIVTLAFWLVPALWTRYEPLEPRTGYRTPYALSEDYWLYERWCAKAKESHDVLVVGDSVVWGEYVRPGRSLASKLAAAHPGTRFANLGLNGIHPAALRGLLTHHADAIRDTRVILHCNLLWMSSPRRDLTATEEVRFHHARLVPQILPEIPCYRPGASERISITLERGVEMWNWVRHVRAAYFDSQDLHRWTIDHPEEAPLDRITFELPRPSTELRHEPKPWNASRTRRQDFDWVGADDSFQWACFRDCVEILRSRGNRLLVVLGPFNEHMLSATGLVGFRTLKADVEAWLESGGVEHVSPPVLPSEMYADASHPLEEGYVRLAESIPLE